MKLFKEHAGDFYFQSSQIADILYIAIASDDLFFLNLKEYLYEICPHFIQVGNLFGLENLYYKGSFLFCINAATLSISCYYNSREVVSKKLEIQEILNDFDLDWCI